MLGQDFARNFGNVEVETEATSGFISIKIASHHITCRSWVQSRAIVQDDVLGLVREPLG